MSSFPNSSSSSNARPHDWLMDVSSPLEVILGNATLKVVDCSRLVVGSVVRGERAEHVVVDRLQGALHVLVQELLAAGRELDDVAAAVGGVTAAHDQVLTVEVVEQPDQVGGVDAQPVAQRALGRGAVVAQVAQGDEVAHAQPQGGEPAFQPGLDRAREARDQEDRIRGREGGGLVDVDACDHGGKSSAV